MISCLVNGLRSKMRAFCFILMQKEATFTTIWDRFQRVWTSFQPECDHIRDHLDPKWLGVAPQLRGLVSRSDIGTS